MLDQTLTLTLYGWLSLSLLVGLVLDVLLVAFLLTIGVMSWRQAIMAFLAGVPIVGAGIIVSVLPLLLASLWTVAMPSTPSKTPSSSVETPMLLPPPMSQPRRA